MTQPDLFTYPRLPVYLGADLIGEARYWGDVADLLRGRGIAARQRAAAMVERGRKSDRAFHIGVAAKLVRS